MLLEKVTEPFDSTSYITELKLDGFRLILSYFDSSYRLYTRHSNEITAKLKYSGMLDDLNLANGTILDGELIVPGKDGKPNFEAVMEWFNSSKSNNQIQYCVFDILFYKGINVMNLPLLERKALLNEIRFDNEQIVPVQWIEGNGTAYFNSVKEMDLEGIVAKEKNSKYSANKRSDKWLKVINYKYTDVRISGIIKENNSFILQSVDDNRTIGVMEFMPVEERKRLYRKIDRSIISEDDKVSWLGQEVICNVKYRNWTSKGKLRIPSFNSWVS